MTLPIDLSDEAKAHAVDMERYGDDLHRTVADRPTHPARTGAVSDLPEPYDVSFSDEGLRNAIEAALRAFYGEVKLDAAEYLTALAGSYGGWCAAIDAESGPR